MTVVPRVNVDGFDGEVTDIYGLTPPWRQNYDLVCVDAPCPSFYLRGRGYDVNRYHSYLDDADVDPYTGGANPVPEAVAMRTLHDQLQPEVVIDFHHQGSCVDEQGDLITGSTMWPNAVEAARELGVEERFDAAVTLAKRVISVMVTELDPYGYANSTRSRATAASRRRPTTRRNRWWRHWRADRSTPPIRQSPTHCPIAAPESRRPTGKKLTSNDDGTSRAVETTAGLGSDTASGDVRACHGARASPHGLVDPSVRVASPHGLRGRSE